MKRLFNLKSYVVFFIFLLLILGAYLINTHQKYKHFQLTREQLIQNNEVANDQFHLMHSQLAHQKKYSELYLLMGIQSYNSGQLETAKSMFSLSLQSTNDKTDYKTVFYANAYLFDIYKSEGNIDAAVQTYTHTFESIPYRAVNRDFLELGALIAASFDNEVLRAVAIDQTNQLFLNHLFLSLDAELYLRERLRSVYILADRYAEATNSLIESINIATLLDSTNRQADAMISLAIVLSELGGAESAENLIETALILPIDNEVDHAYIQAFGSLNLAYIQFYYLQNHEAAMNTLSRIELYRRFFSEEDFRDIEIFKLIYETNILLTQDLESAKQNLITIGELLAADEMELFINRELDYFLILARYFYATNQLENAYELYTYTLSQSKALNHIIFTEMCLVELISLGKSMNHSEYSERYSFELLALKNKIEEHHYHDYSVFIANAIQKQELLQSNYSKYISLQRIAFLSILIFIIIFRKLRRKIKKLKYNSEYDGLTSVYNRKKFDLDYQSLVSKKTMFACVLMDIDFFKQINDCYGHDVGDIVLNKCAQKIKNSLPHHATMYRYGGEEFIILIKSTAREDILLLAENIRRSLQEMKWQEEMTVTTSIGVSFSDYAGEDPFKMADIHLYAAKQNGRNQVVASPEIKF